MCKPCQHFVFNMLYNMLYEMFERFALGLSKKQISNQDYQ